MKQAHSLEQVRIVTVPDIRVAVLSHRGDPAGIDDTVRKFVEWRVGARLHPRASATYTVLHSSPDAADPAEFRHDLCAATEREVAENPYGVVAKVIPGGRCAVLRFVGSDDHLEAALHFLVAEWLPQSGEKRRDFPVYLQRVRFFPEVPESEAVVDVFLPIA